MPTIMIAATIHPSLIASSESLIFSRSFTAWASFSIATDITIRTIAATVILPPRSPSSAVTPTSSTASPPITTRIFQTFFQLPSPSPAAMEAFLEAMLRISIAALRASKGFITPFTFFNLFADSLVATRAAIADTTISTAIIPPRYFATRLRSSLGILDKMNKDAASTPIAIEIALIFAANPLPDLRLMMLFRLPRVLLISTATSER